MATTPAAGNLDEVLELKLKALVFDEWDYEDFINDGLSSYVEAIKQAFKDAGYVHIPQSEIVTQWEAGKPSEVYMVDGKKVMTGQEWYDNFVTELELGKGYPDAPSLKTQEELMAYFTELMKLVAKRASGIKN